MDESVCSNHDEEAWAAIITKVVKGEEDDETVWAFRFAVEQRVWRVVLSGPQNDPGSAQVRKSFGHLFRGPHAAEDFIAEFFSLLHEEGPIIKVIANGKLQFGQCKVPGLLRCVSTRAIGRVAKPSKQWRKSILISKLSNWRLVHGAIR